MATDEPRTVNFILVVYESDDVVNNILIKNHQQSALPPFRIRKKKRNALIAIGEHNRCYVAV